MKSFKIMVVWNVRSCGLGDGTNILWQHTAADYRVLYIARTAYVLLFLLH